MTLMTLIFTDKKHPPTPLKGGIKISVDQSNQSNLCSISRNLRSFAYIRRKFHFQLLYFSKSGIQFIILE